MDLLVAASFVCALVYGALGLLLARHSERGAPVAALVAACAATFCWALARGVDGAGWLPVGAGVGVLAALHTGAWTAFLGLACRAGLPAHERRPLSRAGLAAAGAAFLLVLGLEMRAGAEGGDGPQGALLLAQVSGRMLLVVPGLVFVETLLGRSSGQTRWRLRYLCVGVGGFLLFDLFVASEALLFRRLDPVLEASRGAVVALAAPLVAIAAARNPTWSAQLNLGRRAVFHSVVLFGIGGYLLALAGAGALLRGVGGDWMQLLEATFVLSGLLLLAVLFASPTLRSLARRRLTRYLFTYRHDYRETWRRFAEALSASGDAPLRQRAVRAVVDMLDSPAGALWIRESDALVRVAADGNAPSADVPADGAFALELFHGGGRIVDLGDPEDPSAARFAPWIPGWLRDWRSAWVLAPLIHRSAFLGFLVLARPPGVSALDAEDEELLETVARQVASYVAEERQTRALEETRRFSDFSREVAFIAHDLRNVANELSLTLSNARTHIQKPEFQRDLLLSMEESVARMQRMLDRLRSGAREVGRSEPVDLSRLLGSSLHSRLADDTRVKLELDGAPLPVAASADRMLAMSGHLIRNAVEAVGPDGHVIVRLRRDGAAALLEVEDDGPGMSPEQLRERLYHPFKSTKPGGFGIGLYEVREQARELGGQLALDSEPGRGTLARLRLPLHEEREAGEER